MKHAQYNYVWAGLRAGAALALILTANTASGAATDQKAPRGAATQKGRIAYPSKPDPLLDGGDTNPCMAGADLAAGMDATGQPVIPADVGAPPTPVPDEIMVPLGGGGGRAQPSFRGRNPNPATSAGGGAYAGFDGRRMAPLLNPRPCR